VTPRTAGFLLFPGFEPLDAFGPLEAFAIAEENGAPAFRVVAAPMEYRWERNDSRQG
jgi:hypothetical protein